jgi:uncharacterized Fe-S radical SAM superfamily protein PflX
MNQKEIVKEKKFQITEVKNIHDAHIKNLKVTEKAVEENKKLTAVFKNVHEAHIRQCKLCLDKASESW